MGDSIVNVNSCFGFIKVYAFLNLSHGRYVVNKKSLNVTFYMKSFCYLFGLFLIFLLYVPLRFLSTETSPLLSLQGLLTILRRTLVVLLFSVLPPDLHLSIERFYSSHKFSNFLYIPSYYLLWRYFFPFVLRHTLLTKVILLLTILLKYVTVTCC